MKEKDTHVRHQEQGLSLPLLRDYLSRQEQGITFQGHPVVPEEVHVANPAFDVTPHRYVTGIVTENGVAYPPFD